MKKASSRAMEICEKISKYSIYVLVFLLPLFFLPWTANVLDFNKQLLLMVLVLVSLIAWWLRILMAGEFSFKLSLVNLALVALFLIYLLATIFSLWGYGSFWGLPLSASDSLLTLLCLAIFYLVLVNVLEKKEIFYSFLILTVSGLLAIAFGVVQLFGKLPLPFDFAKMASFNTIGSVNSLSLFAAVLLPLIISFIINTKKLLRVAFIVSAALSALLLILVNFSVAWWIAMIGSALIIVCGTQRREFFDNRWLILPMFFLALGLFFGFFKFQIPGLPARPIEVYLNQRTSMSIGWEALKARPVLGSGPGTFVYDFSKYKSPELNQGIFWNIRFDSPSSKIVNVLATTGVLGLLSFLALIGLFVLEGLKYLFGVSILKKDQENQAPPVSEPIWWNFGLGIFSSFVALTIAYFLYSSNLTMGFLFFLLLGGFISIFAAKRKEFTLESSSWLTLTVTFIFTLVFIFSLGLFILEGQRYIAEIFYLKGAQAWQEGKSEESLGYLEGAIKKNSKMDLYWRELSQIYLQELDKEARRTDISKEEVNQRAQAIINNAVTAAKNATDLNPSNVANWSVRGLVYQNLIGIVGGIEDWASDVYDKAIELEPTNPYFPTQKGISLRQAALLDGVKQNEKDALFSSAKAQFNKAIELKSDYAPAHFQIAMTYQAEGKQKEAIAKLEETKKITSADDIGLAFQLGLLYYQSKDYTSAKAELERAVSINPNYSNALYFLGLAYDQLGQKQKAIDVFQKVADLNKENTEIKSILSNLKAGREALSGLTPQTDTIPIEEKQPETKTGNED